MKKHNTCPECEAEFDHRPGLVGQMIRCQTCSHLFVVSGPPSGSAKPTSAGDAVAPPPLPPKKKQTDPEPDDRPRASRNSYGRTGNRRSRDEDDKPRNKAARYRDQDDEAGGGRGKSRQPKPASGFMVGLIACLGVLFVAVLAGGVVWLVWPNSPKTDAPLASNSGSNNSFTPVQPPRNDAPRNLDDILNQGNKNPPADPVRPPNNPRPNPNPNPNPPPPRDPFARKNDPIPPAEIPKNANIVIKPLFPAPADAGPKPAEFAGNTKEVSSPHPITRVIPAGSGRYLLLHHEAHDKVSVLDVTAAKIARTITLGQPKTMIAGGHDFFVAYLPTSNEFQRYSLKTLEPDQKTASPVIGEIGAIGMGAASNGPVVICTKEKFGQRNEKALQFIDPNAMKPANYAIGGHHLTFPLGLFDKPIALSVGGNGGVFTAWTRDAHAGVYSYVFGENGQLTRSFVHIGPQTVFPSGDGQVLFTEGRLYAPDIKPVSEQVGGHGRKVWYLPAATGSEYLMIEEKNEGFAKSSLMFEMRSTADKTVAAIPQVDGTDGMMDWLRGRGVPFDQHFFLIPSAKALAVHPPKNPNSIILCRVK